MPPKRQPLLGQIYGLTLFPDTDRVLLQCGRGFVVTDNKGAGNMLKALASILEVGASSAAADSESWCRTPRLLALDGAFASLSSRPVRKPLPRQYPRRTRNKCQFRRQPNYVCLFAVVSYPKTMRDVLRRVARPNEKGQR